MKQPTAFPLHRMKAEIPKRVISWVMHHTIGHIQEQNYTHEKHIHTETKKQLSMCKPTRTLHDHRTLEI